MHNLKTLSLITLILGIVVAVGILFSHLALTDIGHGTEPDLSIEWTIVRVFYGVLVIFLVFVFILISRVFSLYQRIEKEEKER